MVAEAPQADAPRGALLTAPLDGAILRLAGPLFAGYLFQLGFNTTDTYLVGRLGKDALAAVGATMFVVWALFALAEVVTVGVLARVARAVGAGRPDEAGAAVAGGALLGGLLSLAGVLLAPATVGPLVALMGLEPEPSRLATDYLLILMLGFPTLLGSFLLESIFRGAGDTATPMFVVAFTFLLNVVLDVVLIFGWGPIPALGVAGAAAATVSARGLGCLVLAVLLARRTSALGIGRPAPDWAAARRLGTIVRIGAPASAAGLSFCLIYLGLVRITASHGTAAVAALGLGLRLEGIAYFALAALGRAAATVCGQNLGAGLLDRARAGARAAERLGAIAMIPTVALLLLAPTPVVRLFSPDPEVIDAAVLYLRIVALALLPFVKEVVLDNVAAGVGDTVPAMAIEIVGTLLRLPIALALGWAGVGYAAVWWSIAATMTIKALAFEAWFRHGRWLEVGEGG